MKKNKLLLLKEGTIIDFVNWHHAYQDYWYVSNVYIDLYKVQCYGLTLLNGSCESPTITSISRSDLATSVDVNAIKIVTKVFCKPNDRN